MPLQKYRCVDCGMIGYAFPEEWERLPSGSCKRVTHVYEELPPEVVVVHMTEIFMLSQLDSVHTVHELNSALMREATEERELKAQNMARKES